MSLMRTPRRLATTLLTLALGVSGLASAAQVEGRFGSQDGFGIHVASGDAYTYGDLIYPTLEGTDELAFGGFTAHVALNWTGNLVAARMDIFSGGWGLDGDAGVYLVRTVNGMPQSTLLGALTNGDGGGTAYERAYLDSFDLGNFLNLIETDNQVEIRAANLNDGGVLGYILLILQTQDAGGGVNSVPEPTSILLVGAALAAGLAARRLRVSSRTAASGVDTRRLPQRTEPGGC